VGFGWDHGKPYHMEAPFDILAWSGISQQAVWLDPTTARIVPTVLEPTSSSMLRFPLLLHRSHRFSKQALGAAHGNPSSLAGRVWRNLRQCSQLNPDAATAWYDNAQASDEIRMAIHMLPAADAELVGAAWAR
jgi:hypothetical protein